MESHCRPKLQVHIYNVFLTFIYSRKDSNAINTYTV